MADKITIMIAEDHPLFGQGLRRVLEGEDDIEIVAEVNNGKLAVERAAELQPDVILMDINLPGMNGLQATREIRSKGDDTAIIVLTAYHDEEQLFHAIRAGAAAYFPKDVSPATLIRAIREVARGNYVIGDTVIPASQVANWLLKQFEELAIYSDSPDEMFMPLTAREMEILQYITKGASNKEIARALGISRQTVKNHMSSILRKLAVNDRTQAAVLALRRGWIRLQDTAS
ncbi:MAG: response regulator transcription factor [Anaerolineae bacterium]|nr:response regulator transcription factor [Anaerolineae bacterium]MDW8098232.1 response regulator transcription factor [Anaerolineae bacterium]